MNLMLFGDIHIVESEISEINEVFSELIALKKKYFVDGIILTGDSFDKSNPTTKELDCFASFLKALNCPIQIIVAKSHESISETESVINHFHLLQPTISICSEYSDANNLYVGHYTLQESKYNYGSKISKDTLRQYKYVILGHQHSYEVIKPNICHIGSIRYVDFAEATDKEKMCLIIKDYGGDNEKCIFFPIMSAIPMISINFGVHSTILEGTQSQIKADKSKESGILGVKPGLQGLLAALDNLSERNKIRIVFKDYQTYREFLSYSEKYKQKFVLYKEKKEFVISEISSGKRAEDNTSLKEQLQKYLEINKVPAEIKKVLIEEIK